MNGSFNVLIYNEESEELFLYTDKFGSRALFYTETSSEVIVSGRVRPVCHALGSRLGLNRLQYLNIFISGVLFKMERPFSMIFLYYQRGRICIQVPPQFANTGCQGRLSNADFCDWQRV